MRCFTGGHETPCHIGIEEVRQTVQNSIEAVVLRKDEFSTDQYIQSVVLGKNILKIIRERICTTNLTACLILILGSRVHIVTCERIVTNIIGGKAIEFIVRTTILVDTTLDTESQILDNVPLECSVSRPLGTILTGVIVCDGNKRIHRRVVIFFHVCLAHYRFGRNGRIHNRVLQTRL